MSQVESHTAAPNTGEQEPLLGRAGDASQPQGLPLYNNLIIGTGVVAQAGSWILFAIVWGAVFSHDLILFSAHPLLNSTAILLFTQSILILQPTHTPTQKRIGTHTHASINSLALSCSIAALVVIEYNKFAHNGSHFVSSHAILGVITYILILIQALVGVTQFYTPALYGGVGNAKKIYKWHRGSGYLVLVLLMATVAAATATDYNKGVLDIKLWAVLVASVITLIGVLARVKKQKFGLGA